MLIKFNDKYYQYHYYNNDLQFHRLGGPSYEDENGNKFWYKNGNRHREDGPSIELSDELRCYYLNDQYYDEKEYWEIIRFKGFL